MNKNDFMEKLLDGVEVEWLTLKDVASYSKTRVDSAELDSTTFVGVDNLVANKGGRVEANYLPNTARLAAYQAGNILIGNIRPYLKKIWLATNSGGCSGDVLAVHIEDSYSSALLPKYLYYLLSSDGFFKYNMQHAKGAKMPRGNKAAILDFPTPIPCPNNPEKSLKIQAEIVRILDAFTELTTELTTELNLRKKQYNYYREQLFSFDKTSVNYVALGDEGVGSFIRGSGLQKKDFVDEGVECIHYGQIYTHYGTYADQTKSFVSKEFAKKARKASFGDLVIATTSENDEDLCKAVAWLGKEEVVVSSDACYYQHNLNPKFVSYFFQTDQFHKQKQKYITGAKVRRVNADSLAKMLIPIPSEEEQLRIVTALDKFDALTNSITDGLPREIELRQKQYEYYRDLLFSFPKPEAA